MISEFAQDLLNACQSEKSLVGFQQPIMPNLNASLVTQPSECALHNKAQPIAVGPRMLPEFRTTATRSFKYPFGDARRNAPVAQRLAKGSAIISAIRQDPARPSSASATTSSPNRNLSQNAACDLQFMDVGRFKGEGDGGSISIDEDRSFSALANLGDTDTAAPFLAGAKLASKMPCDNFNRPLLPSCPRRTRRMRGHTPSRCQRINLSQQVDGEPYSRGISCQRQPVLSTNRIPLMVRRSSTRSRPRRFLRGNNGWMSFQSFADKSVSRMGTSSRRGSNLQHFK
jgi:hypothetical protein